MSNAHPYIDEQVLVDQMTEIAIRISARENTPDNVPKLLVEEVYRELDPNQTAPPEVRELVMLQLEGLAMQVCMKRHNVQSHKAKRSAHLQSLADHHTHAGVKLPLK
jgi:hypothetical protein